ncbi:MAG: 4-hydroxythreonine-4-phosphate dehydrogenase PdxA [Oscillospiraceae bacterium]|jgi:4-hydroxythreonine-4-phosphate dehydrogenase|nr:4-hydroxythreonine-4-phosphate dehydrogenase PdxA [Oscillospiraceae bacterium]
MGDPSGIGPEIAVKALCDHQWAGACIPVVVGDYAPIADAVRFTGREISINLVETPRQAINVDKCINLVAMNLVGDGQWQYGRVQANCGSASVAYVRKAAEFAMAGAADAVTTGPINKEAFNLAGEHFSGHTEILADQTGARDYAMLLLGGALRVIHVTTHVSMRGACDRITEDRVFKVIRLADESMKLLGIPSPRIAVAGLNPHSSENGLFGYEETQSILPAIRAARAAGIDADGPVPPDTVFVKARDGLYDVVVAMYHDQGHIPIKLLGFRMDPQTGRYTDMSGVNCTVGLPIIRSSVDHGTAFDKTGKGMANEGSLVDAIRVAVTMVHNKQVSKIY